MRRYRIFGLCLESDFPFANRLVEEDVAATQSDLRLRLKLQPSPFPLDDSELVYSSPILNDLGESVSCLYRGSEREIMHFPDGGDFLIEGGRVELYLADPELSPLVELHILGPFLAYVLERCGRLALHASAVEVGGRAVAFMANQGGGKSGLAASFLQAGHTLLSDDILAVGREDGRFIGHPSYPQMRMWPDLAEHFLPGTENLPRIHPELTKLRVPVGEGGLGTFCESPLPLEAVVVPQCDNHADVTVVEMSSMDALMALVVGSFTPYVVEALGLQRARLEQFSDLIESVPVLKVVYPKGLSLLDGVQERVVDILLASRRRLAGSPIIEE